MKFQELQTCKQFMLLVIQKIKRKSYQLIKRSVIIITISRDSVREMKKFNSLKYRNSQQYEKILH